MHSQSIGSRIGRGLLPFEVLEIVDHELESRNFASECATTYLETVRSFVADRVVRQLAEVRKGRGMFDALERNDEWDADTDLSLGASGKLDLNKSIPC
jgi:DNA-directed RNA polymerase III subunit RPC1